MKQTVLNYILENNLINYGDTVICGLSGGADSCAMVHLLFCLSQELSITLKCAHLNHQLRGEEARRDEEFAKQFCDNLGLEFYSKAVDVASLAKTRGISVEDAGRIARYDFFESLMDKTGATKIATAHNKNDNSETVLMHIIRGCGINGLCGIPPKRGSIIRPLLNVSRNQIEAYCKENNILYVTDSSNLEANYTRNKLRLEVIPVLKEINPAFDDAICRLTRAARREIAGADELINKFSFTKTENSVIVDLGMDGKSPLAFPYIVSKAVKIFCPFGEISAKNINALEKIVAEGKNGGLDIGNGIYARISYGKLIISSPEKEKVFSYNLTACAPIRVQGKEIYVNGSPEENSICLPWDGKSAVCIRNRRSGDKIKLRGMTRKLQDMFVNLKIDRLVRSKLLVVTYDNIPIWVEGVGASDLLKEQSPHHYIIIKPEEK